MYFITSSLSQNNKASLTMSLAQGDYCTKNEIDPEDPTCAHVIFTGTMKLLGSDDHGEAEFAKEALFSRHPAMEGWPAGKFVIIVPCSFDPLFDSTNIK